MFYDVITCPRCENKTLHTVNTNKPLDLVSGECLSCGLAYWTKVYRMTLEQVNTRRKELASEDQSLPPLTELSKPLKEWDDSGSEEYIMKEGVPR